MYLAHSQMVMGRALLHGGTLDMPVADAMNKQPIIAAVDKSDDFLIKL